MKELITQERLKELLSYDPETGVFRWRVARGKNAKAGAIAGSKNARGYWVIAISGRGYRAHRLAWLYMTGAWPEADIDHINLLKGDNRFRNLRDATRAQNIRNTTARRNNRCGSKGVYFIKKASKWGAQITTDGVNKWLGTFESEDEAREVYGLAADLLHGEFANHGEKEVCHAE